MQESCLSGIMKWFHIESGIMEKFGIVANAIWHIEVSLALMKTSAVFNVNMQLIYFIKCMHVSMYIHEL